MKLPRLYSIQAKLSAVFLFIVILIACSGMLSVYFSKRHLKTARFFADTIIPEIQRINDLQHAASQVEDYSGELSRAVARNRLDQVYGDLEKALARMTEQTQTITREDNGIDIVSLNFLNQAIRTQAQLVFQLRARLLKMASDQQGVSKEIQRHLLELAALEARRGIDSDAPGFLSRPLPLLDALSLPATSPLNIRQLKGDFAEFHRENAGVISKIRNLKTQSHARNVLAHITEHMGHLIELKEGDLDINQRIGGFITTLDDLTGQLKQLTQKYIEGVRTRFRKNAEQVLKREQQSINFTNAGLIFAILILYLLHWKIIIRGFGNRLSMISRAMNQGAFAEGKPVPLPVQGRDEIADMARSAGELLKKASKLNTLAAMDELTGVYNRRRFFQLAKAEAKRTARKKAPAVVLMIDIDFFKKINDTWGHDFGDRVLREFAAACSQKIRSMDIFARWGGEEFILLMPDTGPDQGMAAAQRLRETIAALEISTDTGGTVSLTVSIGMAEAALDAEEIDEPIKRADTALYQAKRLGRNRVEISTAQEPTRG